MIKHSITLLCIVIAVFFVACENDVVFDEYVTIPKQGWAIDSMAVFNVELEDVSIAYDFYLNVRNLSSYPNSNLWLFVDVISPSGKVMHQKVECALADESGKWLGSGWGDLYLSKVGFMKGVKFAEEGKYAFRIAHGMYDEELSGIYNVGLRIEESELLIEE